MTSVNVKSDLTNVKIDPGCQSDSCPKLLNSSEMRSRRVKVSLFDFYRFFFMEFGHKMCQTDHGQPPLKAKG